MTLRDEFEKLCPRPNVVVYSSNHDAYFGAGQMYDCPAAELYNARYQGFLLGRQNTVSVEKYRQDVSDSFDEGMRQTPWDKSKAKRRTEEV